MGKVVNKSKKVGENGGNKGKAAAKFEPTITRSKAKQDKLTEETEETFAKETIEKERKCEVDDTNGDITADAESEENESNMISDQTMAEIEREESDGSLSDNENDVTIRDGSASDRTLAALDLEENSTDSEKRWR